MKTLRRNFTSYTKDYYKVLNVNNSASLLEIKKRYTTLVKEYHPDINPTQSNYFKDINEAYAVLSKLDERRKYDQIIGRYGVRAEESHQQHKYRYNYNTGSVL